MVRLKHRYLLVNILYPDVKSPANKLSGNSHVPYSVQFRQPSSDQLDARMLLRVIRDGVAELFGDYGSGKVSGSLQIKYLSNATSTAIIRVSRDHYRLVWAALTFATKLPRPLNEPCIMQVVRVSGTIKKAEEEAIRRARLTIVRARRAAAGGQTAIGGSSAVVDLVDGDDDFGLSNGIEDADEPGDVNEESD